MAVPLHAGAITSISLVITVHKRARTQSTAASLGVCGGQLRDEYWRDTHECGSKQKRSVTVVVSGAAEVFSRSGLGPRAASTLPTGRGGDVVFGLGRSQPRSAPHCRHTLRCRAPGEPHFDPGEPHRAPGEPHCAPGEQHCAPGEQHSDPSEPHCVPGVRPTLRFTSTCNG